MWSKRVAMDRRRRGAARRPDDARSVMATAVIATGRADRLPHLDRPPAERSL